MAAILFLQFLQWFFLKAPLRILKNWKTVLLFNLEYFSLGVLLRTFFAPWKQIRWQRKRGFDPGDFLYVAGSNIISRWIGAGVRGSLIGLGIFAEIILVLGGMAILLLWFFLPIVIAVSIFYGITLLFV
ncbi:MAG: hypothetical protein HYW95_00795 [Candidatus Wildermuthbacteria bacterium]|nr:hypothetical protein [Candidatus Wildermuthbacteria bacterium]